jgi:hypothetical protein
VTLLLLLALAAYPVHPMTGWSGHAPAVRHYVFGCDAGVEYQAIVGADTVSVSSGPDGSVVFVARVSHPASVRRTP